MFEKLFSTSCYVTVNEQSLRYFEREKLLKDNCHAQSNGISSTNKLPGSLVQFDRSSLGNHLFTSATLTFWCAPWMCTRCENVTLFHCSASSVCFYSLFYLLWSKSSHIKNTQCSHWSISERHVSTLPGWEEVGERTVERERERGRTERELLCRLFFALVIEFCIVCKYHSEQMIHFGSESQLETNVLMYWRHQVRIARQFRRRHALIPLNCNFLI